MAGYSRLTASREATAGSSKFMPYGKDSSTTVATNRTVMTAIPAHQMNASRLAH